MTTIFDKIVSGELESYIVWQDDVHIAFLTPFPNTPGVTVVIPKENIGNDVFELSEEQYKGLMLAARKVAKILKKALDVTRVALIFEGTGVAHVHAKLYPLHGKLASQTDVWSDETEFVANYRGWITTLEGPKANDQDLKNMQAKIVEAQK